MNIDIPYRWICLLLFNTRVPCYYNSTLVGIRLSSICALTTYYEDAVLPCIRNRPLLTLPPCAHAFNALVIYDTIYNSFSQIKHSPFPFMSLVCLFQRKVKWNSRKCNYLGVGRVVVFRFRIY